MDKFIRVGRLGSKGKREGYLPMSQSQVWRLIADDPTFPRPSRLTERISVIRASELDAWLEERYRDRVVESKAEVSAAAAE